MMHHIYSVYDRLAEMYGTLTNFQNDKVAVRSFKEACRSIDGYKQHPEDLEIHRIGTFNDETGTFTMEKEILEKGGTYEI